MSLNVNAAEAENGCQILYYDQQWMPPVVNLCFTNFFLICELSLLRQEGSGSHSSFTHYEAVFLVSIIYVLAVDG